MGGRVALFLATNILISGLSHLLQPQAWRAFVEVLHANGRAGAFASGLLALIAGSAIVGFHNVSSVRPVAPGAAAR